MGKKVLSNYQVGKSPFLYAGFVCNNHCIFCFEADQFFENKKTSQLKTEMRNIRKNFDFINFMGQEPTLRKDILALISYARTLRFKQIGITTNGRMFSYADFAKKILSCDLNQIVVTVTGRNPKIHDFHTNVSGSFAQTLAGIKNILRFKREKASLIINIMVTQKNYQDLENIVDFYAKLGAKEINIGHVMPLNKNIMGSKKTVAKMKKVVPYLIRCHDKHQGQIKFLFVEYPACVFPPEYRHLAFPCLEENTLKMRIKACDICSITNQCSGILKHYLRLYGEKEFCL